MESPNNFKSQNLDTSGNFSIEVIIEALDRPYGLQLLPFFSSDPRAISAHQNTCNGEIDNFTGIFIVVDNVQKEATHIVDGSRDINEPCEDSFMEGRTKSSI